jgi:hypothetical protein
MRLLNEMVKRRRNSRWANEEQQKFRHVKKEIGKKTCFIY